PPPPPPPLPPLPVEPPPTPTGAPIFGANEFILTKSLSEPASVAVASASLLGYQSRITKSNGDTVAAPINRVGIIAGKVNESQIFYLEAKNATKAYVLNLDTKEKYSLNWDADLKLWVGELVFDEPGFYRLEGHISNDEASYKREINGIFVAENTSITDKETGEPASNVVITIYEKNVHNGRFQKWNGEAYGQPNPAAIGQNWSVVLPEGEFFIEMSADGYRTSRSLIMQIDVQSIVTGAVELAGTRNFIEWLQDVTTISRTDNFKLSVKAVPERILMEKGKVVPEITLHDADGKSFKLYDEIPKKPTVIGVYSMWNTLAQEELKELATVMQELQAEYDIGSIGLTTMEPDNVNLTQLNRGDYQIDFYKPTDRFHDDYFSISLPTFYVLNEERELLDIIAGPRTVAQLKAEIIKLIEEDLGQELP
ncbi:TlpA family protein disulfide reductase, partial [Patescibacteria group bacterium]